MNPKIEFKICKANEKHTSRIVELFKKNYKNGYFTSIFESEAELKDLLNDDNFMGLVAILNNGTIVAFSGIYFEKNDYAKDATGILDAMAYRKKGLITKTITNINQVYLAHFVVDERFRGLGIGKAIEEEKFKICHSLPGKTLIYSLVLETSLTSIYLKKLFKYDIWGMRLFYYTMANGERGHVVIMGHINGFSNDDLSIEKVSEISKVIVNNSSRQIKRLLHEPDCETIFLGKAEYHFEPEKGRSYCNVNYDLTGEPLENIILRIKKDNCSYSAIYLNAQDLGIHNADKILIENNFFPVAFLPYFANGTDIIEYQYINKNNIKFVPECLINKKQINNYLGFIE